MPPPGGPPWIRFPSGPTTLLYQIREDDLAELEEVARKADDDAGFFADPSRLRAILADIRGGYGAPALDSAPSGG